MKSSKMKYIILLSSFAFIVFSLNAQNYSRMYDNTHGWSKANYVLTDLNGDNLLLGAQEYSSFSTKTDFLMRINNSGDAIAAGFNLINTVQTSYYAEAVKAINRSGTLGILGTSHSTTNANPTLKHRAVYYEILNSSTNLAVYNPYALPAFADVDESFAVDITETSNGELAAVVNIVQNNGGPIKKGIAFHQFDFNSSSGGGYVGIFRETYYAVGADLFATSVHEIPGTGRFLISGTIVQSSEKDIFFLVIDPGNPSNNWFGKYDLSGNEDEAVDVQEFFLSGTGQSYFVLTANTKPGSGASNLLVGRFQYTPSSSNHITFDYLSEIVDNGNDQEGSAMTYVNTTDPDKYQIGFDEISSGTSKASAMQLSYNTGTSTMIVNWANSYKDDAVANGINMSSNGKSYLCGTATFSGKDYAYLTEINSVGNSKCQNGLGPFTPTNRSFIVSTVGYTTDEAEVDITMDLWFSPYLYSNLDGCSPCPQGLTVNPNPGYTCNNVSVNFNATVASGTPSYSWYNLLSPTTILSTTSSLSTSVIGQYMVEAFNGSCSETMVVHLKTNGPDFTLEEGDVACTPKDIALVDNNPTIGATYTWTFTPLGSTPSTVTPTGTNANGDDYYTAGKGTLSVLGVANGCSLTVNIVVDDDPNLPQNFTMQNGAVDCNPSLTLGEAWICNTSTPVPSSGWKSPFTYRWYDGPPPPGSGNLLHTSTNNYYNVENQTYYVTAQYTNCTPVVVEVYLEPLYFDMTPSPGTLSPNYSTYCTNGLASISFQLGIYNAEQNAFNSVKPTYEIYQEGTTPGVYNINVVSTTTLNTLSFAPASFVCPHPIRSYGKFTSLMLTHQLPDGNYRLKIHTPGSYACSEDIDFTIDPYDPNLAGTISPASPEVDCKTGVVDVTCYASGNNPIASIEWFEDVSGTWVSIGFGTTLTLSEGTYFIRLTDSEGCTKDLPQFVVDEATNGPNLSNLGFTGCIGSATINSGTPTYHIYWDREVSTSPTVYNREYSAYESGSPPVTHTTSELPEGTYKVRVVDSRGCEDIDFVTRSPLASNHIFNIQYQWGLPAQRDPDPDAFPETPMTKEEDKKNTINKAFAAATSGCLDVIKGDNTVMYETTCLNPDFLEDKLELSYKETLKQITLYYRDRASNLTKTVPPQGVDLSSTDRSSNPSHVMENQFDFDGMKRMINSDAPDRIGETKYLYDAMMQMRFSQTPKQLANSNFSYTRFDDLGRITETGQSKLAGGQTFDVYLANSAQLDNMSFPSSNLEQRVIHEYNQQIAGIDYLGQTQRFVSQRISHSYTDEDGNLATTHDQVHTYYSYDAHGNVEWLIQEQDELGKNYIRYEYDLISENVKKVFYNEFREDKWFLEYEYNEDNALISARSSYDGVRWESDKNYLYYHHGPLAREELGFDKIQGIDYTYTIKGNLKAVNHPYLDYTGGSGYELEMDPGKDGATSGTHGQFEKDVFSYALGYYNGDYVHDDFNGQASNVLSPYSNFSSSYDLFDGNIAYIASASAQDNPSMLIPHEEMTGVQYRYDQLGRIKETKNSVAQSANSAFYSLNTNDFDAVYSYDANGNLLTLERNSAHASDNRMDDFTYTYTTPRVDNRLQSLSEGLGASVAENGNGNDLTGTLSFVYDEDGNLIQSLAENIDNITWTTSGKIKLIEPSNSSIPKIEFFYDANDQRIKKVVDHSGYGVPSNPDDIITTYYIRDAGGNILSIYERTNNHVGPGPDDFQASFKLVSRNIYGSDRIGSFDFKHEFPPENFVNGSTVPQLDRSTDPISMPTILAANYMRFAGFKKYELTDHLSNVRLVVSDVKGATDLVTSLENGAKILSTQDYYPFGMVMPGRNFTSSNYRFAFNGMEKDDEIKGSFNSYNFKFRMHDPRIGRFFSVDPLSSRFAYNSPFAFAENKVIRFIELEGLEIFLSKAERVEYRDGMHNAQANTAIFVYNVGVSMYNGFVDLFNYTGQIDQINKENGCSWCLVTDESYNKIKTDVQVAYNAVENYVTTTSWEQFKSDFSEIASNVETYENLAGAIVAKKLRLSKGKKGTSVWKLDKFDRGREIEKMLGGNMKSPNYPVIDAFKNGVATSIKSLDLGAASYQTMSNLRSTLKQYVNKLAKFDGAEWGGDVVYGFQIKERVLSLGIDLTKATDEQWKILDEIVEWAKKEKNIRVKITHIE